MFMTEVSIRFYDQAPENHMAGTLFGFDGAYQEYFFDVPTMSLFIGTRYKFDPITQNPYEKANFYELGVTVKKHLPKSVDRMVIDNTYITDCDAVNFAVGVEQSFYQWTYRQTNDDPTKKSDSHKKSPQLKFTKTLSDDKYQLLQALNQGITFTKNLSNMRADELTPLTYAQIIENELGHTKEWIDVKTLAKEQIDELGMGMLAGVGKASKDGYKIVSVEINPQNTPTKTIALIGKGLTFDTGGINIKGGGHSFGMHMDMGGSAIVFGVAKSLSLLPRLLNTKVILVAALVENGINESAMHPGDVVTNLVGQTALVKNTDAEGRLTLADSVPWTVINYRPDQIITLATLTGHAVVAYTDKVAPIFSNDKILQNTIYHSFLEQGEEVINVDLPRGIQKSIVDQSGLADYTNTYNYKPPQGGAQAAAAFVISSGQPSLWKKYKGDLPDKVPMAHIDVAGPTTDKDELNTGYGVRSLIDYCLQSDLR